MIRLAANISTLFTELPFLERAGAAARAGFRAVECQFPYVAEPAQISQELAAHGLRWVLFNAPPGRLEAGERGIASLPGREMEFEAGIVRAMEYVAAGGCRRVHVMSGLLPADVDRGASIDVFVGNLVRAADLLATVDATVMIEPINTRVDVPGYLLDSTRLALECIRAASRPNIQLQYDVYHMQIMEGDLVRSIERLLPWIGHIQIADNPGRHEPGTGEIAFGRVLKHIDSIGYEGHVGCEYLPATQTLEGLGWARPYLEGENA
jgi:hydroxypyruvate isomerase